VETITLVIYDETTKQEIFEFLKKFKPQEAELKVKIQYFEVETVEVQTSIEKHPFFGMVVEKHESVEETMNRLRGNRF